MPTYMMVEVEKLVEPLNPQRQETLLVNIDILRDSIRSKGLEQPIGVRAIDDGTYRIIYGHRRSIAVTQLGWSHVPALVYAVGEGDDDELMGAENYHRNAVNDKEEALYYQRVLSKYPEGTIGMARELNVPQSRIERLLTLAQGDPKVFDMLGQGALSVAQAEEINRFESPGYRLQALERCTRDGFSAEYIKRWRKDVQSQGLDRERAEVQAGWDTTLPVHIEVPQAICTVGNHQVPLLLRKVVEICNEHYNIFLAGLEALGRQQVLQEAGLWPQVMKLIAIAEGEKQDGGRTV